MYNSLVSAQINYFLPGNGVLEFCGKGKWGIAGSEWGNGVW
jgi:hypothetical protein